MTLSKNDKNLYQDNLSYCQDNSKRHCHDNNQSGATYRGIMKLKKTKNRSDLNEFYIC